MAGSFGYMKDKPELSAASCRHQVADFSDGEAVHPIVLLDVLRHA